MSQQEEIITKCKELQKNSRMMKLKKIKLIIWKKNKVKNKKMSQKQLVIKEIKHKWIDIINKWAPNNMIKTISNKKKITNRMMKKKKKNSKMANKKMMQIRMIKCYKMIQIKIRMKMKWMKESKKVKERNRKITEKSQKEMGSKRKMILVNKKWKDMMKEKINIKKGRKKSKKWKKEKMRRMKFMNQMKNSINRFIKICLISKTIHKIKIHKLSSIDEFLKNLNFNY